MRFSFEAIDIPQNSKSVILIVRILFLQHQNRLDLPIILHMSCLSNSDENKQVLAKNVFLQIASEPQFSHKNHSEKSNFEDLHFCFV